MPLFKVTTKRKDLAVSDDDDDDNDDDGDDNDDNDVNNGVAIIILIVGKLSINDSEHGFEKLSSFLGFIQVLVAFLRDDLPETDMSTI